MCWNEAFKTLKHVSIAKNILFSLSAILMHYISCVLLDHVLHWKNTHQILTMYPLCFGCKSIQSLFFYCIRGLGAPVPRRSRTDSRIRVSATPAPCQGEDSTSQLSVLDSFVQSFDPAGNPVCSGSCGTKLPGNNFPTCRQGEGEQLRVRREARDLSRLKAEGFYSSPRQTRTAKHYLLRFV